LGILGVGCELKWKICWKNVDGNIDELFKEGDLDNF
jgi:hypothetical protein